MAWIEVTINGDTPAMAQGNEVTCANSLGEDPDSIDIDGQSYNVADWRVDERDDVLHLTLADADFKTAQIAQEEIPDDEPDEGGDPDNTGE